MKTTILLIRVLSRRNVISISHYEQLWTDTRCNMNQLRCMRIIHTPPVLQGITDKDVSKNMSKDFMAVLQDVVRDLTEISNNLDMPGVSNWLSKLIYYNVPGGKKTRGLETILSFKTLCPKSELTDENLRLSYILGWCVEIFQAYQLVLDDIMDNGITRRGHPCWYRHNDIGLIAINDGILLKRIIYQLLKKHFKNKTYYIHLLELFHDTSMKTTIGQCLDILTAHSFKTKKFKDFTMDNYSATVKYKSSYYTYLLPLSLAMRMININDPDIFRQVKTILFQMGHFFAVQDDFLDCYGDPKLIGKIGTDIEDGKCSWLAVVALQRANSHQKRIMEDYYGIDDQAKVKIIKNLYEELKIPTAYQHYEKETYNLISTHIQKIPSCLLQELFVNFLKKFKKRKF